MEQEKKIDFTWAKFHRYMDVAMGIYATEAQRTYTDSNIMDLAKFAKWKYDQELVQNLTHDEPKVEKKGLFSKLWGKTVFPEMAERKRVKREFKVEEDKFRAGIQSEARKRAMTESQDELVNAYKQKEIDKITGKDKEDKIKKFADAFSMGNLGSTDKINNMLGQPQQQPVQQQPVQQQPVQQQPVQQQPVQQQPSLTNLSGEQIANMLGGGQQPSPQQTNSASGIGQLNIPDNNALAGMMGMGNQKKEKTFGERIRPGVERKRRGRQ